MKKKLELGPWAVIVATFSFEELGEDAWKNRFNQLDANRDETSEQSEYVARETKRLTTQGKPG